MVQALTSTLRDLADTIDLDDAPRGGSISGGRAKIKDIRDLAAASARATEGPTYSPFTARPGDRPITSGVAEFLAATPRVMASAEPVMTKADDAIEPPTLRIAETDDEPETASGGGTPIDNDPRGGGDDEPGDENLRFLILGGLTFRSDRPIPPGSMRELDFDQPATPDGRRPIRLKTTVRVSACRLRGDGSYEVRALVA